MQYAGLRCRPCIRATGIWNRSSEVGLRRRQVLEQIDRELAKGDDRAALFLLKESRGKPDGVRCFGAARQVSNCKDFHRNLVIALLPK